MKLDTLFAEVGEHLREFFVAQLEEVMILVLDTSTPARALRERYHFTEAQAEKIVKLLGLDAEER